MKYRLIAYQFKFIENRYLFPIIVNYEDANKADSDCVIIDSILEKLEALNGLEDVRHVQNRIGTYEELQYEFNSMMGEISLDKIKTIDVELHIINSIDYAAFDENQIKNFHIENLHLPIRKLDFNDDICILPSIIVDYVVE